MLVGSSLTGVSLISSVCRFLKFPNELGRRVIPQHPRKERYFR
uniref:Uncharacterized protein n=1 Tax=Arundo donax TaxID=35708 RepID=A0A0A9T2V9_ARUDO